MTHLSFFSHEAHKALSNGKVCAAKLLQWKLFSIVIFLFGWIYIFMSFMAVAAKHEHHLVWSWRIQSSRSDDGVHFSSVFGKQTHLELETKLIHLSFASFSIKFIEQSVYSYIAMRTNSGRCVLSWESRVIFTRSLTKVQKIRNKKKKNVVPFFILGFVAMRRDTVNYETTQLIFFSIFLSLSLASPTSWSVLNEFWVNLSRTFFLTYIHHVISVGFSRFKR